MAVSKRQVGTGVGAGAIGVIASESVQHARLRGLLTRRQAQVAAAGVGLGATGLGVAAHYGLAPFGPTASAGLAGFGIGTLAWTASRELGIAPRLTLHVPDEVDLLGPVVTGAVLSIAGLAFSTARDAVV